jgi:hydrogenase maturation factor HypE
MITTDRPDEVIRKLREAGIECTCIGAITEKGSGRYIVFDGEKTALASPGPDELYKVFRA